MGDDSSAAVPVLTIDGPSGSGKGTISRHVAQRLGWHYLDSGALYRAVGLAASWADIDLSDASALVRCTFDTEIGFREDAGGEPRVIVNGLDATSLAGVTRSVEYLGSTVQVGVDVMGLETLSAVVPEARFDANPVAPGQPVVLSWTPKDVHVLGR